MNIIFRVDASLAIGTGHVLRCLTLAAKLKQCKVLCHFVMQTLAGNLCEYVRNKGYEVYELELTNGLDRVAENNSDYASWVYGSNENDAKATLRFVKQLKPIWIIADHYGLDSKWEKLVSAECDRLMVIDDLANRDHVCNLLLDQNLGRKESHYRELVPSTCKLMLGPQYALLRDEFSFWRKVSLERRAHAKLKRILVNLGGVDSNNLTLDVLKVLSKSNLTREMEISVVLGSTSPHVTCIVDYVKKSKLNANVTVNARNMAEIMAGCDIAIGAAGSTAWERCCLGVPTIILVLAENQVFVARQLEELGAALVIKSDFLTTYELTESIANLLDRNALQGVSSRAARITTGEGASVVVEAMQAFEEVGYA